LLNTITILSSELAAYGLLLKHFEAEKGGQAGDDPRLEILRLRKEEYPIIVDLICLRVNSSKDKKGTDQEYWRRAGALMDELNRRYHDVFGECMAPPSRPVRSTT
jgi:hypothetical protein